jgi:hypothetical protein
MPTTLPNLYATPADLVDYLGSEGVELRLDDHLQATGQTVSVVGDQALGATTITISPLIAPLLAGTLLEFDGGGMPAVLQVNTAAVARVGDTSLTVLALTAPLLDTSAAEDSGVNVALAQRMTKACQYATGRVKFYCCKRYDDSELVKSWSVNRWATALGCQWLCRRRANAVPASIDADAEEALEEMKGVSVGSYLIEDIGLRTSGWPFMSNLTVDLRYEYARARVQPSLSEATPTIYGQFVDWNSWFAFLEY